MSDESNPDDFISPKGRAATNAIALLAQYSVNLQTTYASIPEIKAIPDNFYLTDKPGVEVPPVVKPLFHLAGFLMRVAGGQIVGSQPTIAMELRSLAKELKLLNQDIDTKPLTKILRSLVDAGVTDRFSTGDIKAKGQNSRTLKYAWIPETIDLFLTTVNKRFPDYRDDYMNVKNGTTGAGYSVGEFADDLESYCKELQHGAIVGPQPYLCMQLSAFRDHFKQNACVDVRPLTEIMERAGQDGVTDKDVATAEDTLNKWMSSPPGRSRR